MKQKIKTWLTLAKNDLSLAKDLLGKKGRAYYAAHFCHQSIEKMLKAVISEKTDKIPLPTHNFKILLDQSGLRDIPEKIKEFIFSMTPHYRHEISRRHCQAIQELYKEFCGQVV